MIEDQKRLLADLAQTRRGGSFALACDGKPRATAHELTKLGFAEWRGISFGSSFWAITDAGMAEHERSESEVAG